MKTRRIFISAAVGMVLAILIVWLGGLPGHNWLTWILVYASLVGVMASGNIHRGNFAVSFTALFVFSTAVAHVTGWLITGLARMVRGRKGGVAERR